MSFRQLCEIDLSANVFESKELFSNSARLLADMAELDDSRGGHDSFRAIFSRGGGKGINFLDNNLLDRPQEKAIYC